MDKQRIIFNMPDGKEIVVKGLSKEEVDAVLAQNERGGGLTIL